MEGRVSGVTQPEPLALGSPRSGANQRNECDGRQTADSGGSSTDNHSKDVLPAAQTTDDKKVSGEPRLLHLWSFVGCAYCIWWLTGHCLSLTLFRVTCPPVQLFYSYISSLAELCVAAWPSSCCGVFPMLIFLPQVQHQHQSNLLPHLCLNKL